MTKIVEEIVKNPDDNTEEIEDDGFEFPADYNVIEMLEEIPLEQELPSVTERYFTPHYCVDVQKPMDDICIQIHSNRICMLTLAPSHPLVQENCKIDKISFKVTDKVDRSVNKISGKGKHGAQALQQNSNICIVTCADGTIWQIKCCMNGKLIEVNEGLLIDPSLLKKQPHDGGYIAIILPNLTTHEVMKKKLMSEEDYQQHVANRQSNDKISQGLEKRPLAVDDCPIQEKIQKME